MDMDTENKKPKYRIGWEERFSRRFTDNVLENGYGNDLILKEATPIMRFIRKELDDARKEVWVDVDCEHSWLPLGDKLRECLKCDRTQVLATLREEETK